MKRKVTRLFRLSVAIFLPLSFIFAFVSKSFSQSPVSVSSFSYLNKLLKSTEAKRISITKSPITSSGNYDQLNNSKTVVGITPDITLNGSSYHGIYGTNSAELHLENIQMFGFASTSQQKGAALCFENGAHLYFNERVLINNNSLDTFHSEGTGVYIRNGALWYA